MQVELFESKKKYGKSYRDTLKEYRQLIAKGANRVHLVWLKKELSYSICFHTENFIRNRLNSVYEFIK